MESVKDIYNTIKDRISNPLIFSFMCSWLVINWKISIGMLFLKTTQIEKAGYSNVFDFICNNLNCKNSFWFPLLFALGYTFLMPIIKNLISAFISWTTKWGDNWNLRITKGMQIPFEKYLKLRNENESRSKILENLITNETKSHDDFNKIRAELMDSKLKLNELSQEISELNSEISKSYDVSVLNGYWSNIYSNGFENGITGYEDIFIENGKYYIIKGGNKVHTFNITNFHFDKMSQSYFFIKERLDMKKIVMNQGTGDYYKYYINTLIIESENLMSGKENDTTIIKYQRM